MNYIDGLKNMVSSERFTTRCSPFRRRMLERIRRRARSGSPVVIESRFYVPRLDRMAKQATGKERMRLGKQLFESYRFRFYHRKGRVRPGALWGHYDLWPGYSHMQRWPRYRSGMEKRKEKVRPDPEQTPHSRDNIV